MAKTYETLMEIVTIICWDETGEPATMWTTSPKVRREWESYGFPVTPAESGWCSEAPVNRISYKTLQNSQGKRAEK